MKGYTIRMRLLIFLLVVFMSTCANTTEAATLYMDPIGATLFRGDALTVAVRIDTDEQAGECINAVDGVISYPDNLIPVDVSIGRSIFPLWVEQPTINRENKTITFAGGIPNGYCGRVSGDPRLTNVLVDLVFRSPGLQVGSTESGNLATISFAPETTVYLNDGFGTPAQLRAFGTNIELLTSVGDDIIDEWRTIIQGDTFPPEPFSIELVYGLTAQGMQHYIVFSTTDKQSGLSHYEVLEEPVAEARWFSFGAATAPWERVAGPVYVLKDQTLSSIIRVRAVDKAGNEYLASLQPAKQTSIYEQYALVGGAAALLLIMVVGMTWFFVRRRKIRGDYAADHDDDSEEIKS